MRISTPWSVGVSTRGATIQNIWVDHNVHENGLKGIRIHVKFNVNNMKGKTGQVAAYFYFQEGKPLKDLDRNYRSSDGQVSVSEDFTPGYQGTLYNDFTMFIPYDQLHMNNGEYDLKFEVLIWSHNDHKLAKSDWITFQFRK